MGLCHNKLLPIFLVATAAMLSACTTEKHAKIPVVDQTRTYQHNNVRTTTIPTSGTVVQTSTTQFSTVTTTNSNMSNQKGKHIVQPGETLYSLAFTYGRDWRDLAAANNIEAPYVIHPGQTIYLSTTNTTTTTTATTHKTGSVKVTTTKETTGKTPTTSRPTPVTKDLPKPTTAVVGGWTWPAMGTVIGTYSLATNVNKGIDIAAAEGTAIVAASAGTVVYAGNNLHGYGNLLIIKHNDSFVSAYGHNRTLLVKEGQKVKTGQKIAEMGSTGADKVKLHFEIRLNGKPVDPLKYLPKK